jgi:hypothetical protein
MNYRFTTILLTVALLLVIVVPSIQAAPSNPSKLAQVEVVAPAGNYDFTNHGTAWMPELPGKLDTNKPVGWGRAISPTLAGSYWVHIPIPFATVLAGSAMKMQYIEFCAQSSNGVGGTKPVTMDLWENAGKFLTVPVVWAANNSKQCFGYTFNPTVWHQDLGISVLLTFVNPADTITLYKAWVRVQP